MEAALRDVEATLEAQVPRESFSVLHHSMDRMIEVDAVFRSPLQPGPTIFLSSDESDECAASVKLEVKSLFK